MFIIRIVRYLLGYVTFCASGNHIENFFNLLMKSHLHLWDCRVSENTLYACMRAGDYRKIRKDARRCGARVRIQKKHGMPFVVHRYRRRIGILAGFVIFFLLLAVMSGFIWSIDITGNEMIDSQEIMDHLRDLGVYPGVWKSKLDARSIEQQMILRINKLSWIAVNIEGSSISVRINEREVPPTQIDIRQPCNVIAAKSGFITYMEVYSGQEVLKVGSTVREGNLIVSGVVEDKKGKTTLVHARAKVIAQVSDRIEVRVSYQQLLEAETGQTVEKKYLEVFGFKIPLFFKKEVGPNYILTTEKNPVRFLGISLPFRIIRESYRITEIKEVTLTEQQAKDQAVERLNAMEKERFAENSIKDVQRIGTPEEKEYVLTADYLCEQDIALQQEFYSDSPMR